MDSCRNGNAIRVDQEALRDALAWIVDADIFADTQCHGNTTWRPRGLAVTALLWAWSSQAGLVRRFSEARSVAEGVVSGEDLADTYQGFVKALARWSLVLLVLLVWRLRSLMEAFAGEGWRVDGWAPMAVDGTRIDCPRTRGNERSLAVRRRKKRSRRRRRTRNARAHRQLRPQLSCTLFWHVGLQLPWAFRHGDYAASEPEHAESMLDELPERSLVLADAGLTGYEFWRAALAQGHGLLIRVGRNVRLLRKLGCVRQRGSSVFLWPAAVRRRCDPPIHLRLVVVHDGRSPVYLVTSLLGASRFPDARLGQLYRQRWGVEVSFRNFKQTFDRRKLRSGTPENAMREQVWSLVGLWCLEIVAVKELLAAGQPPAQRSVATVLSIVRTVMTRIATSLVRHPLWTELVSAVRDTYKRRGPKSTRPYPRRKRGHPPGAPTIRPATSEEISAAKTLQKRKAKL